LISDEQGEALVKLARRAVTTFLSSSTTIDPPLGNDLNAGVFVTLNYLSRNKEEHLRGCIGFPLAHKGIHESVIEAAIAAATADPRFPPVDLTELRNIIFEVSVLTPPIQLTGNLEEIQRSIKIGRDGLILKWKNGSGLLLPQVPVEHKWSVDEFLDNLCYKAGAPSEMLNDETLTLYSFHAIAFKELEPSGRVSKLHF
jgi:uncharacterized protein